MWCFKFRSYYLDKRSYVLENRFYYDKSFAADKFQVFFKNTILEIKNNPLIFQIRYKNIRVANLKNFPFSMMSPDTFGSPGFMSTFSCKPPFVVVHE